MKSFRIFNILLALAISTMTTTNAMARDGYLTDTQGAVVRSGTGLCWHTGSWTRDTKECEQVSRRAPAPIYLTREVEPAVQVRTVYATYTLQAQALFDFDKAVLSEHGKRIINEQIIRKIRTSSNGKVIEITGYADQIGTDKYNLRLSLRRANAVKAYLIKQGFNGHSIETMARGEARPVVSCKKIKGKADRRNKALIKCLQPNRRIELILTGKRPVTRQLQSRRIPEQRRDTRTGGNHIISVL